MYLPPRIARKTSIKLIARAVSEGWIRQLAFYHMLKFRFENSCIYNYRGRMDEIAGMFDISSRTLYSYLNFLRSKELICDHANNLKIKSIREFTTRKKSIMLLTDGHNLFDVTCLLYAKLIEQKAKQQAFAESARRFGRGDRFISVPGESPFHPSLSFRSIAKILNCSESKAFKVIKNLNRLEVLRTEKQKPQMLSDNFTELRSVEDYPGYRFNIGSKLFEIFGTRVELIQFPVYLRSISMKQYLKYIRL